MRLIILLFLINLLSCSSEKKTYPPETEIYDILGVEFYAYSTRAQGATVWTYVSGTYKLVLNQNETSGKFDYSFYFVSYKELEFCLTGQACNCDGAVVGSFVLGDGPETQTTTTDTTTGYSPLEPYVITPTPTPSTELEQAVRYTNYIALTPVSTATLSPYCQPQTARTIGITKFNSGEIVVFDSYREILFKRLE